MRLVIVGGVAGGATAAARARRLSEDAEIVLFERGLHISYANCGLPYYIGGEIEKRNDLFVSTPEKLNARYRIDVRTGQEVTAIDREGKSVEIREVASGRVWKEDYHKLILSPGAKPFKPNLPGVDGRNIFSVRDISDTDAIKEYIKNNRMESAVVVGGGFIGLEMAENLARLGLQVTVVELLNQILPPLDYEMAAIVQGHLRRKGIVMRLGESVQSFQEENGQTVIMTSKGQKILTDMVILAIGVRPEKVLAEGAGLAMGNRGGILVDEMLCTSDPDIFAVGDAIEIKDYVSGGNTLLPLAGPANKQGRIAADNALGRHVAYKGSVATSVIKVFNLTAATTGNNEKFLKAAKIPYLKSFTHSAHHVTYYPGAKYMAVKLLFSPEGGRILGAQVVGEQGVDKRIDVIAASIMANRTVEDLQEIDLAYAPQFGAAKDPVNIAGYVASNIRKGDVKVVHWDELDSMQDHVLLDVRTSLEVKKLGLINGAKHIYIDELRDRLGELDKDKKYILYCAVGQRAYLAYRILAQHGFEACILSGSWETWKPASREAEMLKSGE